MAAGPVSRILSALRQDDHSSGPRITAGLKRPTRRLWRAEPARAPPPLQTLRTETKNTVRNACSDGESSSLFGLAPCGVCPARGITAAAVRSYRTFSPLPRRRSKSALRTHNDDEAVCFLWHFPSDQPTLATNARIGHPPGRYPAHCSAEFGLSSALRQRSSGPAANYFIIVQRTVQRVPAGGWPARIHTASFGARRNA